MNLNKKKKGKKNKDKSVNLTANKLIYSSIAVVLFVLVLSSLVFKYRMGIVGELISKAFFITFGLTAYAVPFIFIFLYFALLKRDYFTKYRHKIWTFIFLICIVSLLLTSFYSSGKTYGEMIKNSYSQALNYRGGGFIFTNIYFLLHLLIADVGIYIFSALAFFISYFILTDKSMHIFFKELKDSLIAFINNKREDAKLKKIVEKNDKNHKPVNSDENLKFDSNKESLDYQKKNMEIDNISINYHNEKSKPIEEKEIIEKVDMDSKYKSDYIYIRPPKDLLSTSSGSKKDSRDILNKNAKIIVKTLGDFGIDSEVVNINSGPTITSYEVKPQSGVKVSKIVNLSNDLSLALASSGIRIEAPIPGKPYVGIEVPNVSKDLVAFRDLLFSEEFQRPNDDITVAIGKNIFGKPIYANINDMPHLLIAGATGSGKSVLVNIIIMSILYKYSPEDVQFIMIDPKMVELNVYNGIPHLSNRKVITDAARATNALKYAVDEMVYRFEKFAKTGCRDIKSYNEIMREEGKDKMPYFVVIIDELSDLMMESSKDVENYITRLAQMGRACGIHLIVATQRPSVDVITGVIKANIPSRISFQVSSGTDSRTILDMSGAEKLLGKGDMLFFPAKLQKPIRVQAAFVTDKEVEKVVTFIKNQNVVESDEDFNEKVVNKVEENPLLEDADEILSEAIDFVIREKQASISAVQRRFRVGYARAGRIIDQMEKLGIVGEHDGSKPRKVLKDITYLENGEDYEEEENEPS